MEYDFFSPLNLDFEWQIQVCIIFIFFFFLNLKSFWCAGSLEILAFSLQVQIENTILKR